MKITLVSTYAHPVALGLRYVSSYLKAAGHDVHVLFMGSKRDTAKVDYTESALEDFIERLRERDLIGLSLMTNTFRRACVLTQHIREAGITAPIIWGGTHPTVAPDECLEVADIVCVGEGEEPLAELVETLERGKDPRRIANLGFRGDGPFGDGQAFRNPVRPLDRNLDDLPFPDYELETHWVAAKDGLVPARPDNLRGTLHRLRVETTRGCPYHCAFCNNAVWLNLYKGKGPWVRKRSADNIVAEVRQALACFPTIEAVNFVDDLFFVRSEEAIEEFARRYRQQVNLPLELDAFPNTITERKVRALARLPIELISMGIQSGSPDTLRNIYDRPTPLKKIVAAMDLLRRYRMRTEYHYIVNNPYEPDENVIETMHFIARHHNQRSVLRIFPLMFYPGTPLYDRARADGHIGSRHENAYQLTYTPSLEFAKQDYLAIWLRIVLYLRNVRLPSWAAHRLVDFVTHGAVRRCLDRRWFGPAVYGGYVVGRKLIRNLVYQPFIRPFRQLRHRLRRTAQPAARWHTAPLKRQPRYREMDAERLPPLTPRVAGLSERRDAGRAGAPARAGKGAARRDA
jgi:radical SAM superfamily enzyme YgiQ (UPF0313 family)